MKIFRSAGDFIILGNIWIAAASVACCLQTSLELGFNTAYKPYLLLVFFATLFIYCFHRYYGVRNDPHNTSHRHIWAKNNYTVLRILIIISVIGLIFSIVEARMFLSFFLIPFALIAVAYTLPLLTKKKVSFRVRDIPYVKTFAVAGVWAGITVLVPVVREGIFSIDEAWVFTERFLFVFAITIPFEIRDSADDHKKGVITLANKLGEKKSKLIACFLLVLFSMIAVYRCFVQLKLSAGLCVALVISAVSTLAIILLTNKNRKEYFYLFVLDGTMILQFLLSAIFSSKQ